MRIYSGRQLGAERSGGGSEVAHTVQIGWGRLRRRFRGIALPRVTLFRLGLVISLGSVAAMFTGNSPGFSIGKSAGLPASLLVTPPSLAAALPPRDQASAEFEPVGMDEVEDVVEDVKPAQKAKTAQDVVWNSYRVGTGESLWSIAKRHDLDIPVIVHANPALSDPRKIHAGQTLKLPNMDVIKVRVRAGQNLWEIARLYSVGAADIKKFNTLVSDKLSTGQILHILDPNLTLVAAKRLSMANKSGMLWPTGRRSVSSVYGYRMHPIYKRKIFHEGIDLRGHSGSPVYAALDGRVSFVGWVRGYGKIIVVRHGNGLSTRYAHLSATQVKRGQRIVKGQVIGKVGKTGTATGPNLHFEVRKNGLHQNPLTYLK